MDDVSCAYTNQSPHIIQNYIGFTISSLSATPVKSLVIAENISKNKPCLRSLTPHSNLYLYQGLSYTRFKVNHAFQEKKLKTLNDKMLKNIKAE